MYSLPRVQYCIIYDESSNAATLFEEETVGVSSQPASSLLGDVNQRDFMIKVMSLSDSEHCHLTGCFYCNSP